MCFQCCQSVRITGQHKKLSLGGAGRRLAEANTRGRARLCLFLNLKIKTLFTLKKIQRLKLKGRQRRGRGGYQTLGMAGAGGVSLDHQGGGEGGGRNYKVP